MKSCRILPALAAAVFAAAWASGEPTPPPTAPSAAAVAPAASPDGGAADAHADAPSAFWLWRLLGRFHPISVHFPIALLLAAAILEAVRLRQRIPAPGDTVVFCLALGAAGAVVAAALGWANAETGEFSGRSAEILAVHRWLGFSVAAGTLAAAVLAFAVRRRPRRGLAAAYAAALFLSAAAVCVGGHYGGMLVYGEQYLTEALPFGAPGGPAAPPAAVAWTPGQPVDFARHVQPIFRQACYECHGPDKQKGRLRLDSRRLAFQGGISGPVILQGDGNGSPLLQRILGQGDKDRMPFRKDPLPAPQIALIKAWIDQGAPWPDAGTPSPADEKLTTHWAYQTPVRPEPLAAKNASWVRNPIDAFVLAGLEKEGLSPAPEAPRAVLIRRASLDLIGLPPSPEEVDAFATDAAPDAYEKVVDRLLASSHYGERWARPWLDLARYADTHGYEKDASRAVWKYRDWVIEALNRDMPYDRFTIEQIAGDMLPNATTDQIIATGFHRNTMINEEGGVDGDESYWQNLVDRVSTTATVWLGTTLACAQCHNHKFDPFTQKDFYRLLAFFDHSELNSQRNGLNLVHYETTLELPTPEQEAKRRELQAELVRAEAALQAPTPELEAAQAAWERDTGAYLAQWLALDPESFASSGGSTLVEQDDRSILVGGENPVTDVYTVTARTDLKGLMGVRLEVLTHPSLPLTGPGRYPNGEFALTGFEARFQPRQTGGEASGAAAGGAPAEGQPVVFAKAAADTSRNGHDVQNVIAGKERNFGWSIPGAGAERQAVFLTDKPFGAEGGGLLTLVLRQELKHVPHQLIGRFRLSVTTAQDPAVVTQIPLPIQAILALPADRRAPEQAQALAAHYRATAPLLQPARARIAELRHRIAQLGIVTTYVMKERPSAERPSTHVRDRGNFLVKADQVYAGVPEILPPLPEDAMPNRLGLARWLVDERNPLTSRVAVNRLWEQVFGRGIVETSEDFGTQGQPPSHPELLDWLATEFPRLKWSQKAMLRLIVTSATYRQDSRAAPDLVEKDPYNRLLARGPRFRMEGEMLRDVALAAGGLLSRKIGGPSVFPFQPEGIWNVPYNADQWKTSAGENRHRRGLYTFWRRTSPYPPFMTFDAPSREVCCVRRIRTNSPLQSLTLLNDPSFFEAAQGLAKRVMGMAGADAAARAAYAFRVCAARAPAPAELERLTAYFRQELEHFQKDVAAAATVADGPPPKPKGKEGEAKAEGTPSAAQAASPPPAPPPAAPPDPTAPERAAWTMVANVLLNLDEAVTKE